MYKVDLKKLLEVGAHFGHQVRRWNPKMKPYLYGAQEGVHVFDLVKTKEALEEALDALKDAAKAGKIILFVGTKKQAKEKTREAALEVGSPYVTERWLGGTFSNFDQINKSIRKLSEMKATMAAGGYAKYTKKERLLMEREIARLERFFGGIAELKKIPEMVVIVDTHRENGVVKEAKEAKVEIVGIVDSNADPIPIDYPIPMNDDATKALDYVLSLIKEAILEGQKSKPKPKPKKEE